jgi:multicomponent Na+:H+ antiporter subunit B
MRMREKLVLRVVSKALVPFILLFALYVQFHGDFGPGGGFQAGVLFAAGLILYGLIFGLSDLQEVVPLRVVEVGVALGVMLFGGVGIATMIIGRGHQGVGNFLDYNVFGHPAVAGATSADGQHLGILLVELGVGITVSAGMLGIFYMFAGRGQRREQ